MMRKVKGTEAFAAQLINNKSSSDAVWMLPEECPIAICINRKTYAVMLASPIDLEDFARGFCHSEGVVKNNKVIKSIKLKQIKEGFKVDITLTDDALDRFNIIDRRSASGCGICGLTSVSHIVEDMPKVKSKIRISIDAVHLALNNLAHHTPVNKTCFSVHAAAFSDRNGKILLTREDVGRHNALDKLFGALIKQNIDIGSGFVIVTSRLAYELAQKCVRLAVPLVVSISAPSTMAVQIAEKNDLSLASVSGKSSLMIFNDRNGIIRY